MCGHRSELLVSAHDLLQDMPDLERHFFSKLGGHVLELRENKQLLILLPSRYREQSWLSRFRIVA
jgi:hypothetical protein